MPNEAGRNYITREGAKRLQGELADLRHRQRPKIVQEVSDAAAQGDRSENAEYIYGKRKLREIDRRVQWLTKRLESATVVEPRTAHVESAFFGAFVEVEDDHGGHTSYRIVGEDEIDLDKGYISWRSPLGRALLKKRAGDSVVFHRPRPDPKLLRRVEPNEVTDEKPEEIELTVVSVRYEGIGPSK
ncbi:MAG TPA: transcription elongation factor GreB [Polyangiaceae bacterium]|nr:transcription elongation factor GreB [Polyangiaceae bacterium]